MANSGSLNTNGYEGRYLTLSWNVANQSVANNTTTINWTLKGAGSASAVWYMTGPIKATIDGKTVYSSSYRIELRNGTTVASGQFIIEHGSNGNRSFTASVEAAIYVRSINCTGNGAWDLPQIPRKATITAAPDFNDEGNLTIQYSNPAGTAVSSLQACVSLTGATDNINYRDVSKTGSTYTFAFTAAERTMLRQAAANVNDLAVTVMLKTVIAGATYTATATAHMTVINATPTLGTATYADVKASTKAITGNDQIIIRNNSIVYVTVAALAARKYATLQAITVTCNNATVTTALGSDSANEAVLDIGTINSGQDVPATITLIDSRGNTATTTLTITLADWQLPSALVNCGRRNNYYTETDLRVNAEIASLNGNNALTITAKSKKTTDSAYGNPTTLQNDVVTTLSLDNEYAWDVQIVVADRLGQKVYNLTIDRGIPILFIDRVKRSVGINCFPMNSDSLELNGEPVPGCPSPMYLSKQFSPTSEISYTGISITVPERCVFVLTGVIGYNGVSPQQVLLSTSSTDKTQTQAYSEATQAKNPITCTGAGYTSNATTYYLWGKWAAASTTKTTVSITGYFTKY